MLFTLRRGSPSVSFFLLLARSLVLCRLSLARAYNTALAFVAGDARRERDGLTALLARARGPDEDDENGPRRAPVVVSTGLTDRDSYF